MIEEITIKDFNLNYGKTAYGHSAYTLVSDDDLETYVYMVQDGYTIPYFCVWEQFGNEADLMASLEKKENCINIHKIIKG